MGHRAEQLDYIEPDRAPDGGGRAVAAAGA